MCDYRATVWACGCKPRRTPRRVALCPSQAAGLGYCDYTRYVYPPFVLPEACPNHRQG
jgi:hypothetical protein